MEKLRALLELYGQLDMAVIKDDPDVAKAVDNLLPGAATSKGWYSEIEHFLFGKYPGNPKNDANAVEALNKLVKLRDGLKPHEKLRLLYGVAALSRIQDHPQNKTVPGPTNTHMKKALKAALTDLMPGATKCDERSLKTFKGHVSDLLGRRNWDTVSDKLKSGGFISDEVAQEPICKTATATVDGLECVVVDTEFTCDDLSLNDVKKIADPRNWAKDYHEFFCDIEPLIPRADGWGRFLETVGFCSKEPDTDLFKLVTQLKFFKSTPSTTQARLDFDLDDPSRGRGDGKVLVDRGFVNMYVTPGAKPDDNGVRVRTRKVVHIAGLSPGAQARLVCLSGYGTASRQFLLGAAERARKNTNWEPVSWDIPADAMDPSEKGDGKSRDTRSAEPVSHIANTAVELWSNYAEDVVEKNLDLSDKWMAGRLTFNDLANYSNDVGGLLLRAPWEFLQAMSRGGVPRDR